jgi:hypothetical protein
MKTKEMRPQDIVVLAKIVALGSAAWKGKELAQELRISPSEVSESLRRSQEARLLDSKKRVQAAALFEFLCHGIRYVYPASRGAVERGIPTAYSAPPLAGVVRSSGSLVWPHETGNARGESIAPLYASAPEAALADPALYEILALIDTIRIGRTREVALAQKELEKRLRNYAGK